MQNNYDTKKLTMYSILTAIVIILQYMGSFIKLGTFSVSLVLLPIVIGAALYGPKLGAWLGFVFSVVVLISGDAALFLGINYWGTVVTVILKGTLAGLLTGFVYNWLKIVIWYSFFNLISCAVILNSIATYNRSRYDISSIYLKLNSIILLISWKRF